MNKTSFIIFITLLFAKLSYSQIGVFTGNDTNITLTSGEQFIISLKSNPAAGYNWAVKISEGADKIVIISSEFVKSKSPRPCEEGEQLWRFKTISRGEVKLELSYIRPWEKKEPASTITFDVKVE